ncbi:MAG: thiolase family protein [Nitrososphaerota archaeon]|nr:thiolase family protein [Nitrososphaerota archaeon]
MSVYVVSAVRTPLGKLGGALKDFSAVEMGSIAITEAVKRSKMPASEIGMVIMGNVLRAGQGQDISRQCAIRAGIPNNVDAYSVDMVCASGMISIINAVQMISAGDAHVVVAGGTESMSQAQFAAAIRPGARASSEIVLKDTMFYDGLRDPFNMKLMGEEADIIAKEHGASREKLDRISYESHIRAGRAADSGYFDREIVPLQGAVKKDEGIRRDTSIEKLSELKPAFGGLHTAGSSSQISDGAAALVLADEFAIKQAGVKPIARIRGYSWAGVESYRFPEAPIIAVRKLLERAKMKLSDVDYFENNEAFAVSSYIFMDEFKINEDRLNPWGGAIALGHPIGASGARIVVTMLDYLNALHAKTGIASICHGIGGATAMAFEKVN